MVKLMNKALILVILISFVISSFADDNKPSTSEKSPQKSMTGKNPIQKTFHETIIAKAYLDKEKKKPVYTERHTAFYKNGKLQTSHNDYFDLNGKKIAELNSNYSKSLMMPTYVFQDFRTGNDEGLRYEAGKYLIFRKKKGKFEEVKTLDNVENIFSCQGWHYYLIANLDQLKKNPIKMNLIFPSKLDYYSFRVRPLDTTVAILKVRVEFDSWVFRLFTPHLDITYDKKKRKIVQYFGPSNILTKRGKIQSVYVVYD